MNSNVFVYKYTFSVTLPKLCKNDLVIIPRKLAKELGGCSQLLLCEKVAESMGFIDLLRFNYVLMSSAQYYHYEDDIHMLPLHQYKTQFEILDSNPADRKQHHKLKSTLNKYASRIYEYNVTRCGEWVNNEVRGSMGQLPPGALVEGFDLSKLNYTEDLTDIDGYQQFVLVRLARARKGNARAFKLKKLEDEGVMIEEEQKRKKNKRKEAKEDEDFEDFLDDVEGDKDLQKGIRIYKNKDKLKHMTEEQLKKELEDLEIVGLLEDMNLEGGQAEEEALSKEEQDNIDDLISKMEHVAIDKE
jgi:nonsense-mediated mRNA decay protein 3